MMYTKYLLFALLLVTFCAAQTTESDQSSAAARWSSVMHKNDMNSVIVTKNPKRLSPGFYSIEYTEMWYRKYVDKPSLYERLLEHPIIHSIKCLTILRKSFEPSCLSFFPIDYLPRKITREYHHNPTGTEPNVSYDNSFKSLPTTTSTTNATLTKSNLRQTATSYSAPSVTATQRVLFDTDTVIFPFLRPAFDMMFMVMEKRALHTRTVAFEDSRSNQLRTTPNLDNQTYEASQKSSTKKEATKTMNSRAPTDGPTYERVSSSHGSASTEEKEKVSSEPTQDLSLLDKVFRAFILLADLFIFNPLDLLFVSLYTCCVHFFAFFYGFIDPSWLFIAITYNSAVYLVLGSFYVIVSLVLNLLRYGLIFLLCIPFSVIAGVVNMNDTTVVLLYTTMVAAIYYVLSQE